ncbi:hypothetical protein [Devosia sp.]|uniref:hypothetical protein n=1 Tax=Devosia sp. TaxID=1871048 RepID=UPI001AC7B515|nr:hypothetical protein [Devosia sp.]MBN9333851.1 hypothetical protein [Devosia sp.]
MDISALPTRYNVGKASVAAGGTVVTPDGASWYGNAWGDDLFFLASQPLVPPQRIEAANPDGTLTLAFPWPGTAATEEDYEIRYVGIIERSTAQSRRVLEQLGDVKAWADVFVATDADRLALESPSNPLPAGRRVLVVEDGLIWVKETSGYDDWLPPAAFKGDTGNKGWSPQIVAEADGERRVLKLAGYVGGEGLAPTGNVGQYLKADGTWTSTIGDAVDFRGEGFIPRGAYNGATAYEKGDVVRDAGSSWIAVQSTTGNAPPTLPATSNAYWALLAQKGADGTGTGDVVGPAGATDGRFAAFDGATGKLLKELTSAQATSFLALFGAAKGLAPAATSGDVSANRLLRADGTWTDPPSTSGDTEFLLAQVFLKLADLDNQAQFLGPAGNRFADSFDALTYVDVAGATGLNSSVAGILKPAQTAGTTTTISTPSTSADVGTGFTWFDSATPLIAGDVIFKIGVYSTLAKSITVKIGRQISTTSFDVVLSQTYAHPGGGWSDCTLTTPFTVPATTHNIGAFEGGTIDLTGSIARSYHASNLALGTSPTLTADAGAMPPLRYTKNVATDAMTVRSAVFAAAAVPTKMKALINVKEVDAAVAGTDYTLECSRNDGGNWTAMTLTERYTMPTTGLRVVEAAETDVSGQPSGSASRWRFKTLNNKNVELHDVYLYWS